MSRPPLETALLAHAREVPGSALPWLDALRAESLRSFDEQGLPGPRDEAWRFTPLRALGKLEVEAARAGETDDGRAAQTHAAVGDAVRLVFVDGHFARSEGAPPAGLRVGPLSEALAHAPERVRALLGRVADPKLRSLTAANTALFSDGALVEVEPGARVERPVHLVFVQGAHARASHPRVLVALGAGSRAQIVEHYTSAGEAPALTNALSEAVLARGAELAHVHLHEESREARHLGALFAHQEAQSRLASFSLALGGAVHRYEVHTELAGEGASCSLDGLVLGRGAQHVDHFTSVDHATPETTSRQLYKTILAERARGVILGRVHVRPDAQRIDAAQTFRSLLLSDGASVHARPWLEILAGDVRCSHGATVGALEEEALFYLRSRGIALPEAQTLLVLGFASEVTERLPFPALREYAARVVAGVAP